MLWAKVYSTGNYSFNNANSVITTLMTSLNPDVLNPFINDVYPQALVQDTYGIQLTRLMAKIYFSWAVMYQNGETSPASRSIISQFYLSWYQFVTSSLSTYDLINSLLNGNMTSDSWSILDNWLPLFDSSTTLVDLTVLKYIPQTIPSEDFASSMALILSDIQNTSSSLQHAIDDGNNNYFQITNPTPAALSYETIQTNVYNIHQGLFMFMAFLNSSSFSMTKSKSTKTKQVTPPFMITKKSALRIPLPTTPTTPTTPKTPQVIKPSPALPSKKNQRIGIDWKRRTISVPR
jgi:hypothetical protein